MCKHFILGRVTFYLILFTEMGEVVILKQNCTKKLNSCALMSLLSRLDIA